MVCKLENDIVKGSKSKDEKEHEDGKTQQFPYISEKTRKILEGRPKNKLLNEEQLEDVANWIMSAFEDDSEKEKEE